MNAFAITGLFVAIPIAVLGIFTLIMGRKKIHLIWGFFCFSVAWWGFGIYKIATTMDDMVRAIFWWRIAEIGVIFIPVLLIHFVLEFLNLRKRLFLFIFYIVTFILLFFDIFTNYFVNQLRFVFNQFYYISPATPLYTVFVFIIFGGSVVYTIAVLWRAYKKTHGIVKSQIKYLILAFFIGFSGGMTSYLPVYSIDILPVWNATIFIGVLMVTYAIIAKKLFDIKVVLTSFFVGVIAILLGVDALIFTEKLSFQILKGGILVVFLFFGYLLVKSVLKEIKYREEIARAYEVEKHAHRELKRLDEAKNQFIMASQHHLRTPLTSMQGYLDLTFGGTYGKISPEIKNTLLKFQTSTRRLIKIVNEFLDISQFQLGKEVVSLQPNVQIEPILKEIFEELQFEAKAKGLYLKIEKPPAFAKATAGREGKPKIKADPEKLKVALFNIVDNGIKYTHKGGVTVRFKIKDLRLQIIVQDTGVGIAPEDLKTLFSGLFERGEKAKKLYTTGRGIGLYIASKIIEAHKGKIWAESEGEGEKSTFFVELPVG